MVVMANYDRGALRSSPSSWTMCRSLCILSRTLRPSSLRSIVGTTERFKESLELLVAAVSTLTTGGTRKAIMSDLKGIEAIR